MTSVFAGREAEEPLPQWVIGGPTRMRECWEWPAVLLGLTIVVGVTPVVLNTRSLILVSGFLSAVILVAAAVALAVAGLRAYERFTVEALWALHQLRVVALLVVVLLIAVIGTYVFVGGVTLSGVIGVGFLWSMRGSHARRFDRVAAAIATAVVGLFAASMMIAAFLSPTLPSVVSSSWIAAGFIFTPLSAATLVFEIRRLRTGSSTARWWQPEDEPSRDSVASAVHPSAAD